MKISGWTYFSEVFMGVDSSVDRSKPIRGAFYRGSQLFLPLAEFMHVPLDQINYVVCGILTFVIGQCIRRKLSPKNHSVRVRALVEIIVGLFLLAFSFGNQLRVLLLQSSVAYLMMRCLPTNQFMAILVTLWSLFYLTLVHLCRLQYDYGGYTMDISGPVMVQTQRLSSLAFNLVDGARLAQAKREASEAPPMANGKPTINGSAVKNTSDNRQSLGHDKDNAVRSRRSSNSTNGDQRHPVAPSGCVESKLQMPLVHVDHVVEIVPGFVEFFSYMLYFHGSIIGPFIFYTEYANYLKGYESQELPPVDVRYLVYLFFRSLGSGLLSAYAYPTFPFDYVLTAEYMYRPLYQRLLYSTLSLLLIRQKYYFAWGIAELNGHAIGCGYTGMSPRTGRPLYLHVRNLNPWNVETGTNLKTAIDAWNISTTRWLREVFYNRMSTSTRTLFVFILSAFWHGFYLGYYVMFISFALFTSAARIWRRRFRAYFHRRPNYVCLYHAFTFVLTNVIINYGQAAFHLLDLSKSLVFLSSFYYVPHIVAALIVVGNFIYVSWSRIHAHSTARDGTDLGNCVH